MNVIFKYTWFSTLVPAALLLCCAHQVLRNASWQGAVVDAEKIYDVLMKPVSYLHVSCLKQNTLAHKQVRLDVTYSHTVRSVRIISIVQV